MSANGCSRQKESCVSLLIYYLSSYALGLEAESIPECFKICSEEVGGMSGSILIAIIFLSIIILSTINIFFALKCPKCRKKFGLVWQELHQRSICKYCGCIVYDKDWQPPDKGALKTLNELAPFKYRYERKLGSSRTGFEPEERHGWH